MRRVLFWIHLCAGSVAGVVILVLSLTGVLLAYERQLTTWADGHGVTPPTAGTPRLPVETLAARVAAVVEGSPTSITLRANPAAAAEFGFGRERTVFVDPWTGEVLGEGSKRARAFFGTVEGVHRWLAAEGPNRPVGRSITGAANLLFLYLALSGLFLWLPQRRSAQHLRPIVFLQRGLRGRARDFNWHNALGFWVAVPLVVIAASGVVMSYPWANELVHRLAGSPVPPRREPAPGPAGPARSAPTPVPVPSLAGLDRAWASAEAQVPGWQSLSLRVPSDAKAPWTFTADTSTGARRPDTRTQLSLERESGAVLKTEGYAQMTAGRKAIGWLRFLHTGEAVGVVGQTVAGLASAVATVLVWTGLSLALRRFAGWRKRRRAAGTSTEDAVPAA